MRAIWIFLTISSLGYAYDWSTNPGDGSEGNPYQISEPNQLIAIGSNRDLLYKHFILMNDIDLAGRTFTEALIAPYLYYSLNLGFGIPFTGTFDGQGYSIRNLNLSASDHDYIGLFGIVWPSGQIKNLGMTDGCIQGHNNVGGLIGHNDGDVISCFSTGTVSGTTATGGLVGFNAGGIKRCFSAGIVSGTRSFGGGLVGYNNGTIELCYTASDVSSDYHNIGGFVGLNAGAIANSYAQGTVSGSASSEYVGGFAGHNTDLLISCYSSGPVSGGSAVGGFIGGVSWGNSMTSGCFWDTTTSGLFDGVGDQNPDPNGVTGLDDPNMMIRGNFMDWDFADDGSDGPNNFWRMCMDGMDYPILSWEYADNGDYACPDGLGIDDLEALAIAWLTDDSEPDFNYACDGGGDGRINQQEMAILSAHWQNQ